MSCYSLDGDLTFNAGGNDRDRERNQKYFEKQRTVDSQYGLVPPVLIEESATEPVTYETNGTPKPETCQLYGVWQREPENHAETHSIVVAGADDNAREQSGDEERNNAGESEGEQAAG